jgi:CheY-like chemotaxis protein
MTEVEHLQNSILFLQGLVFRFSPKPKVLVVEDDENDWKSFSGQLEKFHCEIERISDGEQAVEKIKANRYDVIFLDQLLPKLTGGEILDKTSGMREGSKVVMVTGFTGNPSVSRALDKGAVILVSKPVTFDTLKLFLVPKYD